jgi:hypothetical protein
VQHTKQVPGVTPLLMAFPLATIFIHATGGLQITVYGPVLFVVPADGDKETCGSSNVLL